MSVKVSPVPKGFRTLTPYLAVRGAADAIRFYEQAFGAEEIERIYGADGVTILHAQVKVGNSVLFLCDEQPANGIVSPTTLGGTGIMLHLYVKDAKATWDAAIDSGAAPVAELCETYWGDLSGKLMDPFGHSWSIASKVKKVALEEIRAQARGDSQSEAFHQEPVSELAPVEEAFAKAS